MEQILIQVCRYSVALCFLVFGFDGIFHFLPVPPVTEKMKSVGESLMRMKFILPTTKAIEILSGLLLLTNFLPYLALILLLPVVFGIVCLQLIFNREKGVVITLFTAVPYLVLLVTQLPPLFRFLYFQNL